MKRLEVNEFGCLTTANGVIGRQGYHVYDINGISCSITAQTGGLGGSSGLYVIKDVDTKISKK